MNRLLLINPNFCRKIFGQAPLNLAYLAAAVMDYIQVQIFDLNVRSAHELDLLLDDFRPTHIGIASYTPNCLDTKNILRQIHERHPNIKTIVGGPHETYRGHITKQLYPWIDYVVRERYAENALVEILAGKNKRVDWRKIFPAYHLLDMNEASYRFDSKLFPGKKMLQYMSSRGCNMHCLFCPSGDYIPLDNQVVIDHLEKIVQMGYEALFFNDVNFASSSKRTTDLMNTMAERGLNRKLEWGCQTSVTKELPDELLSGMAHSGCGYITFSLETVSREGLTIIKKLIDPAVVRQKCQLAKNLGMKIGLYVMFGIHPEEKTDWQWTQATLDRVGEIAPNYVSFSILANYPNSNPNLDYEHIKFGTEDVWNFFDEGHAFHPNCSIEYAEKLKTEITKRLASWTNTRTF